MENETIEKVEVKPKYTKENIINSKRYLMNKDLLNVILEEKEYTLQEVEEEINKFKKRKVVE